jgi:hypothetical protein
LLEILFALSFFCSALVAVLISFALGLGVGGLLGIPNGPYASGVLSFAPVVLLYGMQGREFGAELSASSLFVMLFMVWLFVLGAIVFGALVGGGMRSAADKES